MDFIELIEFWVLQRKSTSLSSSTASKCKRTELEKMEKTKEKSRVLVIGATGRLGHYLTRFSIQSGHPTFALIRNSTFSDPSKSVTLESLSSSGVTLLKVSSFLQ